MLAASSADIAQISGAREVFSIFVERYRHHPICCVKSFFNSISVMNIDIYVQDALVVLEKFENSKHNVVDVTEAGGFRFLGVVKASRPVDSDVRGLLVQLDRAGHGTACGQLAELVESVKHRTVLAHVETLELFAVIRHVVGADGAEESDVVVTVELGHLVLSGLVRSVDLHLPVEAVVEEEVVGHAYSVWLRRLLRR